MKKTTTILTVLFISFIYLSCEGKKESKLNLNDFEISLSEEEEPPLILELITERDTQYFIENEPANWEGLTKGSKLKIGVYDWKLFPHSNIEFEYPRTYTYEADLSITNDIWTLSGNDFKIMVVRSIVDMDAKGYVDDLVSQFGPENCSTKKINKKLNQSTLSGIRLSVSITGTDIELDVLEIKDSSKKTGLIIFQDVLTDANENSQDSHNTLKRIEQSFKIK